MKKSVLAELVGLHEEVSSVSTDRQAVEELSLLAKKSDPEDKNTRGDRPSPPLPFKPPQPEAGIRSLRARHHSDPRPPARLTVLFNGPQCRHLIDSFSEVRFPNGIPSQDPFLYVEDVDIRTSDSAGQHPGLPPTHVDE
jgi:hypothetical protein